MVCTRPHFSKQEAREGLCSDDMTSSLMYPSKAYVY